MSNTCGLNIVELEMPGAEGETRPGQIGYSVGSRHRVKTSETTLKYMIRVPGKQGLDCMWCLTDYHITDR